MGSSRSALDLIPKAVGAVVAAFRTGIHVTDVGRSVAVSSYGSDQSWSMVLPGSNASEAVDKFNNHTVSEHETLRMRFLYLTSLSPSRYR